MLKALERTVEWYGYSPAIVAYRTASGSIKWNLPLEEIKGILVHWEHYSQLEAEWCIAQIKLHESQPTEEGGIQSQIEVLKGDIFSLSISISENSLEKLIPDLLKIFEGDDVIESLAILRELITIAKEGSRVAFSFVEGLLETLSISKDLLERLISGLEILGKDSPKKLRGILSDLITIAKGGNQVAFSVEKLLKHPFRLEEAVFSSKAETNKWRPIS